MFVVRTFSVPNLPQALQRQSNQNFTEDISRVTDAPGRARGFNFDIWKPPLRKACSASISATSDWVKTTGGGTGMVQLRLEFAEHGISRTEFTLPPERTKAGARLRPVDVGADGPRRIKGRHGRIALHQLVVKRQDSPPVRGFTIPAAQWQAARLLLNMWPVISLMAADREK